MNDFTLHLQSAREYKKISHVSSFVGKDLTGKFGLMANHERLVTTLTFGLLSYKINGEQWNYIALPGGVLHFINNELFISTRLFFIDEDYERINEKLEKDIRREENKSHYIRQSLQKMEQEMFKRLWQVGRLD